MRNQAYIGARYFETDDALIGFTEVTNSLASFPLSLGERVVAAEPHRGEAGPGEGSGASAFALDALRRDEPGAGDLFPHLPDPTALLSALMSLGNAAIHLQASQLLEADPTADIQIVGADGALHPLG